ncbi:MAG TPA: hypothetical protein VFX57_03640 [Sulfuricurvum sp.]|nr:hypothetical protein [Sulfuricurvum sp.]
MRHRGAVLLMTLLLIAIMSGGIALLLAQSSYVLNLSQRSRGDAQITKITSDLERILPDTLSKIRTVNDLDAALMLPLSSRSSDGRFTLDISLHSALGVFNINKIANTDGISKDPFAALLPALFARYPIAAPNTFINILLDTIDTDISEREAGSEIVALFPDFHNGSIENVTQFEQIIARYLALTKDTQILNVPWERLIGFEGDKIDINYATPDIVSIIVPRMDAKTLHQVTDLRTAPFESKEQLFSIAPELSPLYNTWFVLYAPGTPYPIIGEVAMQTNGVSNHFRFQFDLQNRTFNRLEIIQ